MAKDFEWSTYTDYIGRFGCALADDLLGMTTHNAAHEDNMRDIHDAHQMDCSSPDVSWDSGFDHFGGCSTDEF